MTLKKVFNVITWILIAPIVAIAIALVGVRVLGYTPFAIETGSMTPTYCVGDLVYVKSVPTEEIQIGDAITFSISEDAVCTHRVVGIDNEAGVFITQGDANNTPDSSPRDFRNVIGVVKFCIPKLGYLALKLSSSTGIYLIVAVAALILFIMLLPDLIKAFSEPDGKEKKKAEKKK